MGLAVNTQDNATDRQAHRRATTQPPATATSASRCRGDPAKSRIIVALEHLREPARTALKLQPHERVALELILDVERTAV